MPFNKDKFLEKISTSRPIRYDMRTEVVVPCAKMLEVLADSTCHPRLREAYYDRGPAFQRICNVISTMTLDELEGFEGFVESQIKNKGGAVV